MTNSILTMCKLLRPVFDLCPDMFGCYWSGGNEGEWRWASWRCRVFCKVTFWVKLVQKLQARRCESPDGAG